MQIVTSYSVKIKKYNHIFKETIKAKYQHFARCSLSNPGSGFRTEQCLRLLCYGQRRHYP